MLTSTLGLDTAAASVTPELALAPTTFALELTIECESDLPCVIKSTAATTAC